jgi:hypothetical protein
VSDPQRFQVPALVVDEASMMVFPHFLALATVVREDGEVMLAGDHRQLSPIVAHDWEREDRPPVVLYQPFASAYEALLRIKQNGAVADASLVRTALQFTFRLPPVVRELIANLYRLDEIELQGLPSAGAPPSFDGLTAWQSLWQGDNGLFLVLHDERESRQSNEFEAQVVQHILASAPAVPNDSIAVITPHRAQRSRLHTCLAPYSGPVGVIDTVERLQGNERPTVIVSATVSDPVAISQNVEFILDLNRSNVAFSRTMRRLIVVCSTALLDHIPSEVEQYQSALLWKSLRALCSQQIGADAVYGHAVRVYTPALTVPQAEGAPA